MASGTVSVGDFAVDAAQALLTGFDTALSKQWREEDRKWRDEDRGWRKDDLDYRELEKHYHARDGKFMSDNYWWRKEDIEQRHLENARYLWMRFVEKNRREIEEKSEQLRSVANLAALIAGFAVVSLVEFDVNENVRAEALVAVYGSVTAITVALMVNSMVQCNLILAAILKNGKTYVSEAEEEEFMFRCCKYAYHYEHGCRPPYPKRTFQRMWERRFEKNWRTAFRMFSIGVPCFLIMLAVVSWVKFNSAVTAILISSIIGIATLYWAMTHLKWSHYLMSSENDDNVDATTTDIDLKGFGLPFDWHARPKRPILNMAAGSSTLSHSSMRDFSNPGSTDHDAENVNGDSSQLFYDIANSDSNDDRLEPSSDNEIGRNDDDIR